MGGVGVAASTVPRQRQCLVISSDRDTPGICTRCVSRMYSTRVHIAAAVMACVVSRHSSWIQSNNDISSDGETVDLYCLVHFRLFPLSIS